MPVELQISDLIGITEIRWSGSHDWSAIRYKYRVFWKNRLRKQGQAVVIYVKEQLECMKVCLWMDDESMRAFVQGLKSRTLYVTLWWASAIGCMIREKHG